MRIFISYARNDLPTCRQLVQMLDAHEVWFDQKLKGGQDWWQEILDKLDWCECFVYLLSPESINSEYCEKEAKLAQEIEKIIVPVIIRRGTQVPKYLNHIHYVDLSEGLDVVHRIVELMNALFEAERECARIQSSLTSEDLSEEDHVPPHVDPTNNSLDVSLPYNYTFRLDQRGASLSTKKSYHMWICRFLENIAGQDKIPPQERPSYLSTVSTNLLAENLSVPQVRAWFGMLIAEGFSPEQPKSAITVLAEILAEDNLVSQTLVHQLRTIDISGTKTARRPRRILTQEQIEQLILGLSHCRTNRDFRDAAIIPMLLVLRTGELVNTRWSNIKIDKNVVKFVSPNSGELVLLPLVAQQNLLAWREVLAKTQVDDKVEQESYLFRRFVRDYITEHGLSAARTVNSILSRHSKKVGLGHISPDDLRISARKISQRRPHELF